LRVYLFIKTENVFQSAGYTYICGSTMDYLLHIDSATDAGTVAISREGVPVSVAVTTETRNHAATINTMIDEVLAGSGITLGEVAAVVVCGGP